MIYGLNFEKVFASGRHSSPYKPGLLRFRFKDGISACLRYVVSPIIGKLRCRPKFSDLDMGHGVKSATLDVI